VAPASRTFLRKAGVDFSTRGRLPRRGIKLSSRPGLFRVNVELRQTTGGSELLPGAAQN
jgi:hypothetical protein